MSWYMPELLAVLLEKYTKPVDKDKKDKNPNQDDNKDE